MRFKQKTFFILLLTLVTAACNPTRKLSEDQYLLNKNKIIVDNTSVSKEDLKDLVKQKPNRKIFGLFRFHLWLYNLVDKEKTERKKAAWVVKTEKENELRRAKGKKEIDTEKLIFREKLLNIGEEPAILDSSLTERTRKQFQLYLFRKGFFHAEVNDTTVYKKNRKANVTYTIQCNDPYNIRNVSYTSKDPAISEIVISDTINSLIRSGRHYDEDELEKERERMALELRNRGYYFFNKNYVTIEIDSALGSKEVDVFVYTNRMNENDDNLQNPDPENHHTYTLNNVFIQTDFDPKDPKAVPNDTSFFKGYYFLSQTGYSPIKKEAMLRAIFLERGELFRQDNLDYTYSRLLDLNIFKFIKIVFNEVTRDSTMNKYELDVIIQLTRLPRHDYTIETEATHAGGNLGAGINLGYRNKNMFKGAEAFDFKMKFATEALRNFTDSTVIKKLFFFNTFEVGPEVNFNIKKLLFFPESRISRRLNPRTNISASFNYQERPDYTRRISNFSFAWIWRQSPKLSFAIYWADVNSVQVDLSQEFRNKLDNLPDLSLRNSYSTHLTPATRVTSVLTNQLTRPSKSFYFLKGNVEWAGNLVAKGVSELLNEGRDGEGRRTITRIPYAQYVKVDGDFSYHQRLNEHNTLVFRIAPGFGRVGANSTSLPFEKSFFVGGANSLRAWQARTLGPGSYKNEINIEQGGDLKFESNIELRSSIIKILEGAAFVDAGNIWTYYNDVARPGSRFNSKNIINEMAIGAGLGLRFDFSFFILRIDGAVKLHDPALDLDDRWVYTKQKFMLKDITPNLAIGYPF